MNSWLARRPHVAWALYDWANSAFATTVLAGFFPAFFRQYWSLGTDPTEATFRLGLANGAAGFVMAVLAPLLGAIADRGGHRVRFVIGWSLLGIAATAGLYFVGQGQWVLAALLFTLGTLGFNGGVVFYDALLVDVARPADYDRVSALGYSLGYLGGGLLFAVNVVMVVKPAWFGLANAAAAVQVSFLTVAVWWLVFMLPLAWHVREQPGTGGGGGLAASLRQLRTTFGQVLGNRPMALFLLAYWLYIDGVNTIVKMAVDYGMALGFKTEQLLAALLLTQFVAFPAALVFGRIGERHGPKAGVLIGLGVYTGVTCWAYVLDTPAEFFAVAVAVGLVQGGVQSLSRSYFGRLVPEGRSAEFFGFFNMVGKFGTVLGPLLMGTVALLTGDPRSSILSLVLLFAVGALLLQRVRMPSSQSAGDRP